MTFVFDRFELDADILELRCSGAAVEVEPQVYSLLQLLLQHADRLVTRDEIIESAWNGRFISDAAVASRISQARAVLGDNGKVQKFIKTLHCRGLRFVGPVKRSTSENSKSLTDYHHKSVSAAASKPTVLAPGWHMHYVTLTRKGLWVAKRLIAL